MLNESEIFTQQTVQELLKIDSLLHLLGGSINCRDIQDMFIGIGQINLILSEQLNIAYRPQVDHKGMAQVDQLQEEILKLRQILAVIRKDCPHLRLTPAMINWRHTLDFFKHRIPNYDSSPTSSWKPKEKQISSNLNENFNAGHDIDSAMMLRVKEFNSKNVPPPDEGDYTWIDDGEADLKYDSMTNDMMGFKECLLIRLQCPRTYKKVRKDSIKSFY